MVSKERGERVRSLWIKRTFTRFAVGSSIFLGYVGLIHISGICAFTDGPSEYRVKAAFLYSFTKFVEWPPSSASNAKDPANVCVLGENPFGGGLREILAGKTFNGRQFAVKELTGTEEARGCLILFIGSPERKRVKPMLQGLERASVLTIGDTQGFAEDGCVIDFMLEDDKLRFEINTAAADRARLKISSKLLSLAKIVK
jgi:hypothetical protein